MRRTGIAMVAVWILMVLAAAPAALGQVRDEAGFFTANAVERANQLISQLRQQTRHEIRVETIPTVPARMQGELQSMGTERFFSQYTQTMARQAGVDGVYVLVCREPSYLKVALGDATQRAGLFSTANRDQLADMMVARFKAREYDQGLLDAVGYVQRTMTGNAAGTRTGPAGTGGGTMQTFPSAPTARSTSPDLTPAPLPEDTPQAKPGRGVLFWVIVIGGGLLLLMFIIRRLAARASTYTAGQGTHGGTVPPPLPGNAPRYGQPYPGQRASGGGFGRGVLGGLLGGAAGGWLQDRMSRRGHPGQQSAPPPQAPSAPTNPDPYAAPPDRDYTVSSGGDFGDGGDDDKRGGGSF